MRISGGSPRRQMQLEWRGPSNVIVMIPVNIDTRILASGNNTNFYPGSVNCSSCCSKSTLRITPSGSHLLPVHLRELAELQIVAE